MKNTILTCDVVVAGGGSAGLAAAVAAAREGASVLLIEKNSFIGGKATAAYVGTVCGLFFRSENPSPVYVSDGFMIEFAERLISMSDMKPVHNKLGLHFLPYRSFDFKYLSDQYLKQSGITPFFHSSVASVEASQNKIEQIDIISYDRKVKIIPKAVVDCTGESVVSTLAGAETQVSEEYQASAQVFSMENVQASSEANLGMIVMKELLQAIQKNELPEEYTRISIVPGSFHNGRVSIKIGIPQVVRNELNKISPLELKAREMVYTVSAYLKENVVEFANAYVSEVYPEVGVRTGVKPIGKYTLSKEEVLSCAKLEHSVARGAWPIEFWDLGKRVHMDFFAENDYYDIHPGCLQSAIFDNLFFAGRNIAASESAIASARVIGTCLQTGFAAGKMACKTSKTSS